MKVVAGHELDREIHSKVMIQRLLSQEEMEGEAKDVWKEQPLCLFFRSGFRASRDADGKITCTQQLPKYSTEIEAAWKVQEKWRGMTLSDHGRSGWQCTFRAVMPHERDVSADADTAPLAICLAALRLVQELRKDSS